MYIKVPDTTFPETKQKQTKKRMYQFCIFGLLRAPIMFVRL